MRGFGDGYVVGVDEVGRGAMAGPVVAVALGFHPSVGEGELVGVNDSKKLSKKRRDEVSLRIGEMEREGLCIYKYGESTVEEIDRMNILQASLQAMSRAMKAFLGEADVRGFLVDGNKKPHVRRGYEVICVKGGDGKSLSIAGASIMAKVYRDGLMERLSAECGGYGWDRNAGYGTKEHIREMGERGLTRHHRLSFCWEKAFEKQEV
jgi:ribonuclease HII